ncbi:MAG: hypothetical protein WD749_12155 [Phycisphaerales bacterium]
MLGLVLFLLMAAGLLWATVVLWTAWMLTHPPRRTYGGAVARGMPGDPSELDPARAFSAWVLRDRGGRELPVWDLPGDDPAGPVVILTHGWGDSRIGGLARVGALAPVASRLILWDLPGQGEAPGVCRLGGTESGALRALIGTIRGEQRAGAAAGPPLVLYGWSLGAGCSIEVAASDGGIAGVIAESPYRLRGTPARNVLAARGLPHRWTLGPALVVALLRGEDAASSGTRGDRPVAPAPPFDRAAHAARLPCPLVVIHGGQDRVSPVEDGRAIAGAAPGGRLVEIEGGGHNDLWTDPRFAEECTRAARVFILALAAGGPGRGSPGSHTVAR